MNKQYYSIFITPTDNDQWLISNDDLKVLMESHQNMIKLRKTAEEWCVMDSEWGATMQEIGEHVIDILDEPLEDE
jgi:hypothetical protein